MARSYFFFSFFSSAFSLTFSAFAAILTGNFFLAIFLNDLYEDILASFNVAEFP
jgi:hypothetical protein